MHRIIANVWMTLDGVVQAPIGADEDLDGGFRHGGWNVPHTADPAFMQWTLQPIVRAAGYLLGRRTYLNFAAHWPHAPEAERSLAEPLNTRPKYVASTTLKGPLAWQHAQLLEGDVAKAVARLKREAGGDLLVIGSAPLVQTLLAHGLLDELRLVIAPVVAGGGKRLFRDDAVLRSLRLVDSQVTSTGALLAAYTPAQP